jgi:hydrogenase-4 component E
MELLSHQFLATTIFLTTIFFHIVKRNAYIASAYGIQSLAVVLLLFRSFLETRSLSMLFIVLVVLAIKVFLALRFFFGFVKKYQTGPSASAYLNLPLTLIVVAGLSSFAHSRLFSPLTTIVPENGGMLSLGIAGMLISLLLMVNRKGVMSQIIGVLSLENAIVEFGVFAGLEQSAILQIGIIFNILVWLIITSIFSSMIYRHFGTLETADMKSLKE